MHGNARPPCLSVCGLYARMLNNDSTHEKGSNLGVNSPRTTGGITRKESANGAN